jgi:large subunit ribosomal protein L30e
VIISSNCPALRRSEIEYYAMLAKNVDVWHYHGDNNDLGTALGKYFRCGVMNIIDQGDADLDFSALAGGK